MKTTVWHQCDCGNPEGHVGPVWHEGQPIPDGVTIGEKLETAAVVNLKPREVSFGLVAIRCGCGDPDSHNGSPRCSCGVTEQHPSNGPEHVCPKPRSTVDLGVAAYYNRNPFKWLAWKVRRIGIERRLRQQGELV